MSKILEWFSCIVNPRSKDLVKPPPGLYVIKTLILVDSLKRVPQCEEKEDFLDQLPFLSNYFINIGIVGDQYVCDLLSVEKVHHPSNSSLRRHISVRGLTWECEVVLTELLLNKLHEL